MNVLGLLLVWALVGSAWRAGQWLVITLITIFIIDLGFWVLLPDLTWYVGLSGLLHGLLVAGLVASLMRPAARHVESFVLAILIVLKLAYEQWAGALPGSAGVAGGAVIVDAHLYGAIGGLVAGLLLFGIERNRATSLA
jgi:rhomboid family GlyGly-CTERM serine protease